MLKSELETVLTAALVALGGAVTAAYGMWRKVKADTRDDKSAGRAYDDLAALLDHYKNETREAQALAERRLVEIERISTERNEAVQAAGKLEASVEYLTEQVNQMRETIEQQNAEIQRMAEIIERMENRHANQS